MKTRFLRHSILCLLLAVACDARAAWKVPNGFFIPEATKSPDGKYGVLVPDENHGTEMLKNTLIEIATGRTLAVIDASPVAVHSEDKGATLANGYEFIGGWSRDGSTFAWVPNDKWFPAAWVLFKIKDAEVVWQVNVLKQVQDAMLRKARAAAPKNYAAAAKMNSGNGSAYPDGFTIAPTAPQPGFLLPWQGSVTLDSNPKEIPTLPAEGNLSATADFTISEDGDILLEEFKVDAARTGKAPAGDTAGEEPSASNATPGSKRPATADKAPATDGLSEADLAGLLPDFISTYVQFDTASDPTASLESYHPEVKYFDHGTVDRDFIAKDKAASAAKWPARTEDITGEIKVKSTGDREWQVTYPSHFTMVAADRSWMEGDSRTTMTVSREGDNFLITAQAATVSGVKKGADFGEVYHVPKSKPVITCDFPEAWASDYEGEGVTASIGEDVVLYVNPIDATDIAGQKAAERATISEDKVKFKAQADGEGISAINGMDTATEIWKATYDGSPTEVRQQVFTIAGNADTAILVTLWAAPEDLKKHRKTIDQALRHITPYRAEK